MAKKPAAAKGNWLVLMKCEVTKEVYCENCTEEQARNDPFEHATDETEIGQDDYEVTQVQSAD